MKPFNLEEYIKNPSRKIVTRDGLNARIICTDRKDLKFPIVALIETKYGGEFIQYYTKDGTYYIDDSYDTDLFFVPDKHYGWTNIVQGVLDDRCTNCTIFESKESAEKFGKSICGYIATVKIEWEE